MNQPDLCYSCNYFRRSSDITADDSVIQTQEGEIVIADYIIYGISTTTSTTATITDATTGVKYKYYCWCN